MRWTPTTPPWQPLLDEAQHRDDERDEQSPGRIVDRLGVQSFGFAVFDFLEIRRVFAHLLLLEYEVSAVMGRMRK